MQALQSARARCCAVRMTAPRISMRKDVQQEECIARSQAAPACPFRWRLRKASWKARSTCAAGRTNPPCASSCLLPPTPAGTVQTRTSISKEHERMRSWPIPNSAQAEPSRPPARSRPCPPDATTISRHLLDQHALFVHPAAHWYTARAQLSRDSCWTWLGTRNLSISVFLRHVQQADMRSAAVQRTARPQRYAFKAHHRWRRTGGV